MSSTTSSAGQSLRDEIRSDATDALDSVGEATDAAADAAEAAAEKAAHTAATGLSAVTPMDYDEAREFLSKDQSASGNVSQETVDGVETTVGAYDMDYNTPGVNRDGLEFSASAGEFEVEGTAYEKSTDIDVLDTEIVDVGVDGDLKVGTAGANAGATGSVDFSEFTGNVDVGAGAEVMGVDAKLEGSIEIDTGPVSDVVQGVVDSTVDAYNNYVDPVVEAVLDREVPNIPDVDVAPALDRTITVSGHIEGGLGVSGEVGFSANVGRVDDKDKGKNVDKGTDEGKAKGKEKEDSIFSAKGNVKAGIGGVFGFGGGVEVK